MQLNYIFIPYREFDQENYPSKLLNEIFDNVSGQSFDLIISKTKQVNILYEEFIDVNNELFFLNFNLDGEEKDFIARAMHICNRKLKELYHDSFQLIKTVDEVSEFYSQKAYPRFMKFERKLRELTMYFLVRSYGTEWQEKVVWPKSLGKKNLQLALEDLSLGQMEKLLFKPFCHKNIMQDFSSEFQMQKLMQKTKGEIINLINSYRPRSLWELILSDRLEMNHLEDVVSDLRKYRNKIAHSKEFDFENYKHTTKLIQYAIQELEKALYSMQTRDFNDQERTLVREVFETLERECNQKDVSETYFFKIVEKSKGQIDEFFDPIKMKMKRTAEELEEIFTPAKKTMNQLNKWMAFQNMMTGNEK